MKTLAILLIQIIATTTRASGVSDCTGASLTNCIRNSLSQVVNDALTNRSGSVNFSNPVTQKTTLSSLQSDGTPMSMTINQCAQILQDRLASFQSFNTSSEKLWTDVVSTQSLMTAVEKNANDILSTESGFATKLTQINSLFQSVTDRSGELSDWINGEKVFRNQLTDIYTQLDQKVRTDSSNVLLTASAIRDALFKMQSVHDHATKVLTAVGDAESHMYEWAGNVSSKMNTHTVDLVSIAQTTQFRSNQLSAIQDANSQLNWVVTQLVSKYGTDAVLAASKAYDEGSLGGSSTDSAV